MKKNIISSLVSLIAVGSATAATSTLVDPFGDGNVTTNTDGSVPAGWDGTYQTFISDAAGGGGITEVGGVQSFNAGSSNWSRSELHSNQDYAKPAAGESTTFTWEVGNINVTTDTAGADFRIQMNATSANQAKGAGAERWLTDQGVMSMDLFFEGGNGGAASVNMQVFTKIGSQASNSDGDSRNSVDVGIAAWDWTSVTNTFSLEITDTGYTWSDSETGFNFTETFVDSPFDADPAEFAGGYWPYFHMQNNQDGRGSGDLLEFTATVVTVPEPSSALLSLIALAAVGFRRKR